jgi:hypothetical protein
MAASPGGFGSPHPARREAAAASAHAGGRGRKTAARPAAKIGNDYIRSGTDSAFDSGKTGPVM